MPTKLHPLMRSDYCLNGHDIRDKSMVYHRVNKKTGKDLGYVCRACLAVSTAKYKAKKGIFHKPSRADVLRLTPVVERFPITKAPMVKADPVKRNLFARIDLATETELLEIALFVAKLIPDTEKPEPDQN